MMCEYGCGQEAKHQLKNDKWCCSKSQNSCSSIIKKNRKGNLGSKRKPFKRKYIARHININILCDYGCGKTAKFEFQNGKVCCSKSQNMCSEMKLINRTNSFGKNKGMIVSGSTRKKQRAIRKGKNYIDIYGKERGHEIKKKISLKNKRTIEGMLKKYPFFSQIEEMRYNPDCSENKEIQVHCKNNKCQNSKEKNGWFTPSSRQLEGRIEALETEKGNGGSYFYCCQKCKDECILYNLHSDPYKEETEKSYTQEEHQTFRTYVLNRDNYKCQYCGEKVEHVHHERPQKLEPFFALDPDLAWSVCKKCHYKYGHKDECSTGTLAKIICKENK